MNCVLCFMFTFLAFCTTNAIVDEPLVYIEYGVIRGSSHLNTTNGRQIFSFEGVPYARPPVGKYRFREPQSLRPWRGVWDGRHLGGLCMQLDNTYNSPTQVVGDEDCLYLNIYTPKLPNNLGNEKLMDVIVYIHGGDFMTGSGNFRFPKYLLDEDIVFVTLNYRLGPLGFLSTEDEVVPGNNGLKDQQFAMLWIQRNIKMFGGNPNNIVLVGSSAGGTSVHYHYFSPKSVGVFHRGISFSSSALNPNAQVENPREKAVAIASSLGCPTKSSYELIECLQYRPARRIVELVKDLFMPWHNYPLSPFGPIIESAGSNPFINKNPIDMLLEGSVQNIPWIVTIVVDESLQETSSIVANEPILEELDERWVELAPHLLDFNFTVPINLQKEVALRIKEQYFGIEPISKATSTHLIQLFEDRLKVVDMERAARLQAAATTASVYFCKFNYRSKLSDFELSARYHHLGMSYEDYQMYLLGSKNGTFDGSDKALTQRMIDLLSNFIKTGVPTSEGITWTAVQPNSAQIDYLQINSSWDTNMTSTEDLGRRIFWETLPFSEPSYTVQQKRHYRNEL